MSLTRSLAFYWLLSGNVHNGRAWLDVMLARTGESDQSAARGRALFGAGLLAWEEGDATSASQQAADALSILQKSDDALWSGYAALLLGMARMSQGRVMEGLSFLEGCINTFKEEKNIWGKALTRFYIGVGEEVVEQPTAARSAYRESLRLFQQLHDAWHSSIVLGVLVGVATMQGKQDDARTLYEQFQQCLQQASNRWMLGMCLLAKGYTLQHSYNRYTSAKMLYYGALHLWRDLQHAGKELGIIQGLLGLAEIAVLEKQVVHAGWLFGAIDYLGPSWRLYRDDINKHVVQVREHMDTSTLAAFETAWAVGQTATLEQAIQKGLQKI